MSKAEFRLGVSYRQVAFFDPELDDPFNDWTPAHSAQGFAWRERSVSFSTLVDQGPLDVEIGALTRSKDARWIIEVPFVVMDHGRVEVATIQSSVELQLAPGDYSLTYAHGLSESAGMWAQVQFRRSEGTAARVHKHDDALDPPAELLMEASPA